MSTYIFWNNKGGTGKTSLIFQALCLFAEARPDERVLAIDACPQANLSELLLGGLLGNGSNNLLLLQAQEGRKTIGGYFQTRLPSPYAMPASPQPQTFICHPRPYNQAIPDNIDLLAGDAILELQTNAMSTLANTQIPGTDTWNAVINWLRDYLAGLQMHYDHIFIDANPSFSIHTQIALAAADRLVLPVMADDSSRRALHNAFALVHGVNLPSPIYAAYSFASRLLSVGHTPPSIHLVVKNRLTQYMGPASAYYLVLTSIDSLLQALITAKPGIFTFNLLPQGIVEIRDFQTTGVVAFAKGLPFTRMHAGDHRIAGRRVYVRPDYLNNCTNAIHALVGML